MTEREGKGIGLSCLGRGRLGVHLDASLSGSMSRFTGMPFLKLPRKTPGLII